MKSHNVLVAGVAASAPLGGCAGEAPAPQAPPSPDVTFLDLSKLDIQDHVQQTSDSSTSGYAVILTAT